MLKFLLERGSRRLEIRYMLSLAFIHRYFVPYSNSTLLCLSQLVPVLSPVITIIRLVSLVVICSGHPFLHPLSPPQTQASGFNDFVRVKKKLRAIDVERTKAKVGMLAVGANKPSAWEHGIGPAGTRQ